MDRRGAAGSARPRCPAGPRRPGRRGRSRRSRAARRPRGPPSRRRVEGRRCSRTGSRGRSGAGTCRSRRRRPGSGRSPPKIATKPSTAIASPIGQSRSAMWCSGPGKPTSVSSFSPRQRVLGLGVGEVALLELARLRHRLAPEDPEDDPEGVEGGQEGARGSRRSRRSSRSRRGGRRRRGSRPWRRTRTCPGKAASARAPMIISVEVNGMRPAQAAHPVDVLGPGHRRDHRAGRHEQERLEEGVGHQMEEPGRVGADRDADDHVADLADRRVGDDPLQVGDRERHGRREDQGRQADEGGDVGRGRARARTGCACGRSGRRRR